MSLKSGISRVVAAVAAAGTPLSELGLPAEVKVQLEDGTATYLAVDWTTSAYDPTGPAR